ncbi:MAG: twin-arginine translocase subunit TatC [Alistipes sp.]|nr:twin-arginine translocase subunit TatC [Alistipes sp.]
MGDNEAKQTFWEHLDELRSVLIRVLAATAVCCLLTFCFKQTLFEVVLAPKYSDFITYRLLNRLGALLGGSVVESFSVQLINTALAQQFIIHLKTALYAAVLCISPYILYQVVRFISPALYANEKRYVWRVAGAGYAMFMVGVLLCYFLIFPLTFRFLGTYQVSEQVVNMISLDSYISTLAGMSLMMGLVFEMPILCWMFAKLHLLNASLMRHYRRHAIVAILIVAAIITPTSDIFTLALVSLPMWLLYETSIVVVGRVKHKAELI